MSAGNANDIGRFPFPTGSMYGIFFMVNVIGKYTIHGSYGIGIKEQQGLDEGRSMTFVCMFGGIQNRFVSSIHLIQCSANSQTSESREAQQLQVFVCIWGGVKSVSFGH